MKKQKNSQRTRNRNMHKTRQQNKKSFMANKNRQQTCRRLKTRQQKYDKSITKNKNRTKQQKSYEASNGGLDKSKDVIKLHFFLSNAFILFLYLLIFEVSNWLTVVYWLNCELWVVNHLNKLKRSFFKIIQRKKLNIQSL